MRGKLVVSVLSFLFLFVNIVNSQTTLVNHEWISRAVSDQNHVLSQDIIGLNAINIFIVTDQNISLNDFEQYVVQESDYFLKHVPLSNRFNIFLVRVNNLGFIPQNDSTVTPSKSTRNSIEQFIKRNFDNSHDYLVYVNNFFGVGSAVVAGGNNIDYFYVSAVMSLTNQGIMAHELGHLVCNLSDENDALATGRDWQLNKLINQTQFGELATINLYGHKDYIPSAEIVNGEIINVNIVDIPREKIPWAALIEDNVPLPTWRVPHISFGKLAFGPGVFNPEDFPYQNSIGAFGDALFAPTTGACIMNIQDPRWGYCKVCEHAWIAQILAKTQEIKHSQPEGDIIIQSSGGNQTSINPILSISFLETGYNTRAYWLIDGVTNESYLNKKDWSVSEASSLINKTLTLRVISEAGLIYNPYNIFKVGHPLVD
ncbi:MAG: hypothetical protein COV57_01710 [Candidatus Liptonbacteria bacterium CG11_big_fil_rev_8_21_14_0_20_35_14]|uniref:Uncharacterized protein n=1 Tax=Candidatus Liptonbacteria bacterium CG11_big_fil_rev_8_21_14_0_20_35_14 TaxID=1974634 RepID=A0A2H0N7S1_9BACT|nr:MAG: hypothetical protein COV57_01710 [Candidatus Liptonbacteria bacterium CG11_big_fil_rev_8_21_14_0_20_35_14]